MKVYAGVATIPERRGFFREDTLPSILPQVNEIFVYRDMLAKPSGVHYRRKVNQIYPDKGLSLGDAGKFAGYTLIPEEHFYYFTLDDDLVYPPDYVTRMIKWIDFYDKQAVVSLHGSIFNKFPVTSYYRERQTYFCLQSVEDAQTVLFPGTGCTAFHSSLLPKLHLKDFRVRNMADIWFGLILQRQQVPAIVIPHSENYLTYNTELKLEDTIWGQEHQDDFIQTAVINQFSADRGFRLFPFQAEPASHRRPEPLIPASEPPQQELSPSQAARS